MDLLVVVGTCGFTFQNDRALALLVWTTRYRCRLRFVALRIVQAECDHVVRENVNATTFHRFGVIALGSRHFDHAHIGEFDVPRHGRFAVFKHYM